MDVEHDTGYWVVLASRAFMRVAEARLRPLGLGVAHIPVLTALAEEGSLTQKDLARRARIEQPTAAVLLQRMDAAGLIERSPDPHDRRSARITLSSLASGLLPQALLLRSEAIAGATEGLSAAEVGLLENLLRRVVSNLDSMVDGQEPVGPKH